MTDIEIAYLAGIFDGEGCITVRTNGNSPSIGVVVQMTHPHVPTILYENFKGLLSSPKLVKEHHKISYRWEIAGSSALPFLLAIAPYVVVKAPQVQLALKFIETLAVSHDRRDGTPDVVMLLRLRLCSQIKEHNHRMTPEERQKRDE